MKRTCPLFLFGLFLLAVSFAQTPPSASSSIEIPAEKHLRNMRQLSFGGENAEAYFSGDGRELIFQSKRDGRECDQIYTMRTDGSDVHLISTGAGRTTCSYFFPNHKRILYSSTHGAARITHGLRHERLASRNARERAPFMTCVTQRCSERSPLHDVR